MTTSIYVTPIAGRQRQQVINETARYLEVAGQELGRCFPLPPVSFDLKGRTAGMYRASRQVRQIRYNPWLFARDFTGHLAITVPHEAAHYIVDIMHGMHHTRPHGREWKRIMHLFGADARATGDYDLEGIPVRRQRCYEYVCGCRQHNLSGVRHRRAQKRRMRYVCLHCREELVYSGVETVIDAGQISAQSRRQARP
jgi:SprT protein